MAILEASIESYEYRSIQSILIKTYDFSFMVKTLGNFQTIFVRNKTNAINRLMKYLSQTHARVQ